MVFNLFKKNKDSGTILKSPLTGKVVPITEVPDPVFSEKMMGEGIAIEPTEGKVLAPCDGKIIQVAPTKHAVGIETANGEEVLIHVGLDTVNLKGEGFTIHIVENDEVKQGDELITFDLNYITENAPSIITPMVITNSAQLEKEYSYTDESSAVKGETVLIQVK
ncbi:MAG TPA: PTS glucose transporter subunit IIA [Pseudogracilibacillus sp.]|nr:PTS glucose transporter subunit IIA [Pseudogracilibacillus sp.]